MQTQLLKSARLHRLVGEHLAYLILRDSLPDAIYTELVRQIKQAISEKEQERIQANFLNRAEPFIQKYAIEMTKLLDQIRRQVESNLRKSPKSYSSQANSGYGLYQSKANVDNWMFSKRAWEGKVKALSIEQGRKPIEKFGQDILDELRKPKKQAEIPEEFLWTDDVEGWLLSNAKNLSKTVIATIYKEVAEALAVAIEEGLSIPKIRDRLRELFALSKAKATQIARTEIIKASNRGWLEGAKASGVVEGKQWLAFADKKMCPQCGEMDGKTMALEKPFFEQGDKHTWKDGSVSVFDYEEIISPPLHCDCRCTLMAIVKEM